MKKISFILFFCISTVIVFTSCSNVSVQNEGVDYIKTADITDDNADAENKIIRALDDLKLNYKKERVSSAEYVKFIDDGIHEQTTIKLNDSSYINIITYADRLNAENSLIDTVFLPDKDILIDNKTVQRHSYFSGNRTIGYIGSDTSVINMLSKLWGDEITQQYFNASKLLELHNIIVIDNDIKNIQFIDQFIEKVENKNTSIVRILTFDNNEVVTYRMLRYKKDIGIQYYSGNKEDGVNIFEEYDKITREVIDNDNLYVLETNDGDKLILF